MPASVKKGAPAQPPSAVTSLHDAPSKPSSPSRGLRFWLIILSGCLVDSCTALDSTIIATALPKITTKLHGEQQYVWLANTYVFSCTAVMPFVGQTSNIFGRRVPMIISVILFSLGNAIAGASVNAPMLIAGRVVSGLGGGGVFVLQDLIICDLVPVRERAMFLGIRIAIATVFTILGPILGGVLAQRSWRWVFFINLPFAGVALLIMVPFLRLKYKREPSWKKAVARIDFLGNFIFVCAICAVLLGLIMGGTQYAWSSWHIIVPLVVGFAGWIAFHFHQASPICKEPSMPPLLFKNRTSVTCLVLTFISNSLMQWIVFFLPVYFQSLKGASPLKSGVDVLPFSVLFVPLAILTGGLIAKYGKYKPIHLIGFGFASVGCGLLSILDGGSPKVQWIWFQLLIAIGVGFTMVSILPVMQASLPESYVATATSTFAFVRNFGFVWGVTIPAVIFNARVNRNLHWIDDDTTRARLSNGGAYGYAGTGEINRLESNVKAQVHDVYASAMETMWQAAAAMAAVAFFLVFLEQDIELRMDMETEFGMEDEKKVQETSLPK
ncbi:putative macrolide phosphotransferase k [Trematosphaeria pertusa]|uniref:Putative macrolide phosphotransferase k n=1 Tax=Trematosphaeria pertusa TaxID=390896 RepID=A0A6A6IBH7_9PLEO|nr:putative macrolide phosphotransferase k [Trematosphaeria pertusa]KAF2246843.1 putative macrolide phosphotransferase k [Trematosphaeria pertusa]